MGLVLNAVVLFNTRYMDAAVNQLRMDGFDVRDEDVARLPRSCGSTSTFIWTPSRDA
ncbi:Tn3 family transposase [Streptomyces albidoflavus]